MTSVRRRFRKMSISCFMHSTRALMAAGLSSGTSRTTTGAGGTITFGSGPGTLALAATALADSLFFVPGGRPRGLLWVGGGGTGADAGAGGGDASLRETADGAAGGFASAVFLALLSSTLGGAFGFVGTLELPTDGTIWLALLATAAAVLTATWVVVAPLARSLSPACLLLPSCCSTIAARGLVGNGLAGNILGCGGSCSPREVAPFDG